MSLRPFRNINRKKTKVINVGDVKIGGDNPISVQSMTNTLTTDVKATINQINALEEAGADIVRVSCPDEDSTKALKSKMSYSDVIIKTSILKIIFLGSLLRGCSVSMYFIFKKFLN